MQRKHRLTSYKTFELAPKNFINMLPGDGHLDVLRDISPT